MNERELREAVSRLPKSIEPPRDLWPGIESRLSARVPWRFWVPLAVAAAVVLVLLGRGLLTPVAWEVTRLAGLPSVAAAPLRGAGSLHVGQWVETDDSSRALIAVGRIGHVEVRPRTRIRLVVARPDEHRLALARGAIAAKVDTVPRLFFVETPVGTAIDLGCAYTLEMDSLGNGLLHVTAGEVEFQSSRYEVRVPMGAVVLTRAGVGPGIPYVEDAPDALRRALAAFDVRGALAAARPDDAISLWHLLQRVDAPLRGTVYDRLAGLVPPPPGVTRAAALALDASALDAYWTRIHRILFRKVILRGVRDIDPRTGTTVR